MGAQALLARGSGGLFSGARGREHLAIGDLVMAKFYGTWHKATVHSFRDDEVVVLWQSEASISALPACDVKLLEGPSSETSAEVEELQQQRQQQQQQLQQQQVQLHLQLQLQLQQQEVSPGAQNKGGHPLTQLEWSHLDWLVKPPKRIEYWCLALHGRMLLGHKFTRWAWAHLISLAICMPATTRIQLIRPS